MRMDDHRAGCSADNVMRDAAQQRRWQWAMATRAYDQKIRFPRSLDKHARRVPITH